MMSASSDDDDDSWLENAAEAAGFCVTPPEHRFSPELDADSICTHLAELARLQHAALNLDGCEAHECGKDLTQPFTDSDLLRVYADTPCTTLVITFGGLTQGYPGLPTPGHAQFEFVGAFRRMGVAHALFLRDPLQSWYMRRASQSLPDPYASLTDLLRREVATLRPARVVTIGASMGGYAAIRAAVDLGAQLAVAFGPQVFLHPDQRRHLQLPWQVMDAPLEGLRRDASAAGIEHLEHHSLTALMGTDRTTRSGARQSPMRIAIHCGGRSDLFEATLLQRAVGTAVQQESLSSSLGSDVAQLDVHVHFHRRHGHNLAFQMRADGFLEPLLRAHLAPLGALLASSAVTSVAAVVASDNNGEAPPDVSGARQALSREERLEVVRRANAGQSSWLARGH